MDQFLSASNEAITKISTRPPAWPLPFLGEAWGEAGTIWTKEDLSQVRPVGNFSKTTSECQIIPTKNFSVEQSVLFRASLFEKHLSIFCVCDKVQKAHAFLCFLLVINEIEPPYYFPIVLKRRRNESASSVVITQFNPG